MLKGWRATGQRKAHMCMSYPASGNGPGQPLVEELIRLPQPALGTSRKAGSSPCIFDYIVAVPSDMSFLYLYHHSSY